MTVTDFRCRERAEESRLIIGHFRSIVVVHQYYQSEVNNEYVIRGNAAILKCSIPSFVAEFVQVVGWQDDQGNSFNPDEKNGRV